MTESNTSSDWSRLHCLVTGASSGIGRAICQTLARKGAKVVGTGRNRDQLNLLKQQGTLLDYIEADLTKQGECKRVLDTANACLGKITTVVNAAGVLQPGAVGDINVDNYHFNMICNTQVPFEIIVHAVPYLQTQKDNFPSIINISSVNGKQAFAGCATYCMSKAALDQLTRCASVDLAKHGIRVNSVNPGVIQTNLQMNGGMSPETYQQFLLRSIQTTHPIAQAYGRVGQPEEVAELVAFLVSENAKFITGECIAIDGGRQNLGAR